MVEILGFDSPY